VALAWAKHRPMLAESHRFRVAIDRVVPHRERAQVSGQDAYRSLISSTHTLKPASVLGPNALLIATSVASRPRATRIRPIRARCSSDQRYATGRPRTPRTTRQNPWGHTAAARPRRRGLGLSSGESRHDGQPARQQPPDRAIEWGSPASFSNALAESRSRPGGRRMRVHQLPKPSP
jgi:hypothetical protein